MNPNDIAPLIGGITTVIAITAIVLLRPISKRLGAFLEVLAEERRRALSETRVDHNDLAKLANTLENIDRRLGQLEERQAFTDKLLAERQTAQLHKG